MSSSSPGGGAGRPPVWVVVLGLLVLMARLTEAAQNLRQVLANDSDSITKTKDKIKPTTTATNDLVEIDAATSKLVQYDVVEDTADPISTPIVKNAAAKDATEKNLRHLAESSNNDQDADDEVEPDFMYWVTPIASLGLTCGGSSIKSRDGEYTCIKAGEALCQDNDGGPFGRWTFGITEDNQVNLWTPKNEVVWSHILEVSHVCVAENRGYDTRSPSYSLERPHLYFYDEKTHETVFEVKCDGTDGENGNNIGKPTIFKMADNPHVGMTEKYPIPILKLRKGRMREPEDNHSLFGLSIQQRSSNNNLIGCISVSQLCSVHLSASSPAPLLCEDFINFETFDNLFLSHDNIDSFNATRDEAKQWFFDNAWENILSRADSDSQSLVNEFNITIEDTVDFDTYFDEFVKVFFGDFSSVDLDLADYFFDRITSSQTGVSRRILSESPSQLTDSFHRGLNELTNIDGCIEASIKFFSKIIDLVLNLFSLKADAAQVITKKIFAGSAGRRIASKIALKIRKYTTASSLSPTQLILAVVTAIFSQVSAKQIVTIVYDTFPTFLAGFRDEIIIEVGMLVLGLCTGVGSVAYTILKVVKILLDIVEFVEASLTVSNECEEFFGEDCTIAFDFGLDLKLKTRNFADAQSGMDPTFIFYSTKGNVVERRLSDMTDVTDGRDGPRGTLPDLNQTKVYFTDVGSFGCFESLKIEAQSANRWLVEEVELFAVAQGPFTTFRKEGGSVKLNVNACYGDEPCLAPGLWLDGRKFNPDRDGTYGGKYDYYDTWLLSEIIPPQKCVRYILNNVVRGSESSFGMNIFYEDVIVGTDMEITLFSDKGSQIFEFQADGRQAFLGQFDEDKNVHCIEPRLTIKAQTDNDKFLLKGITFQRISPHPLKMNLNAQCTACAQPGIWIDGRDFDGTVYPGNYPFYDGWMLSERDEPKKFLAIKEVPILTNDKRTYQTGIEISIRTKDFPNARTFSVPEFTVYSIRDNRPVNTYDFILPEVYQERFFDGKPITFTKLLPSRFSILAPQVTIKAKGIDAWLIESFSLDGVDFNLDAECQDPALSCNGPGFWVVEGAAYLREFGGNLPHSDEWTIYADGRKPMPRELTEKDSFLQFCRTTPAIRGKKSGERVGNGIGISQNGNLLAVGAPGSDAFDVGAGDARLYAPSASEYHYYAALDFTFGDAKDDNLGWALAMSKNGKYTIVGIPGHGRSTGRVRAMKFNGIKWVSYAPAIDGALENNFEIGYAMDISNDGKTAVIGSSSYQNGKGIVRVYRLFDSSRWDTILSLSGDNAGDQFGSVVSLSADGNTVAIGSPHFNEDKGRVTISTSAGVVKFIIDGDNSGDQFGHDVSLSSNGKALIVGSPFIYDGQVKVYALAGASLRSLLEIYGAVDKGYYGYSVSISGSGEFIAIGSLTGAVQALRQVYQDQWSQIGEVFHYNNSPAQMIRVSEDGGFIALGTPAYSRSDMVRDEFIFKSDAGAVTIFELQRAPCFSVPSSSPCRRLITYYKDADSDGFGDPAVTFESCGVPDGYVTNKLDCDDGNAEINPSALEICNDIDENCDGNVDEGGVCSPNICKVPDGNGGNLEGQCLSVQACQSQGKFAIPHQEGFPQENCKDFPCDTQCCVESPPPPTECGAKTGETGICTSDGGCNGDDVVGLEFAWGCENFSEKCDTKCCVPSSSPTPTPSHVPSSFSSETLEPSPSKQEIKLTAGFHGGFSSIRPNFGHRTAISGDYAVVSAPFNDENGAARGALFFYKRDGNDWILDDDFIGEKDGDRLGTDLAFDGSSVFVGGYLLDFIYVLVRDASGNWKEETKLFPPGGIPEEFVIATDGTYTAVCVSRTRELTVFNKQSSTWVLMAQITPPDPENARLFCASVAVHNGWILVGDPYNSELGPGAGGAYSFQYDILSDSWQYRGKLSGAPIYIPPSPIYVGDLYGMSVAMHGNYAFVGAPGSDAADVNAGAVYVFKLDNGETWTYETELLPSGDSRRSFFGNPHTISCDDNTVFIGAPGDSELTGTGGIPSLTGTGAVYEFKRDSLGTWDSGRKFFASDAKQGDAFGRSVALSENFLLVGSPSYGEDIGAAYLYRR